MYATKAEIFQAIATLCQRDGHGSQIDGTYSLQLGYDHDLRPTLRAVRIEETAGYEVAYTEVLDAPNLDRIELSDRFGVWSDNGKLYLDRTMHISGLGNAAGAALDVARTFNQKSIWGWARSECISTSETATAL